MIRSSRNWTTFTLIPGVTTKKIVKQRRVTKKMKANKCFVTECTVCVLNWFGYAG